MLLLASNQRRHIVVQHSFATALRDLQTLDVLARVPNRDDAGTPHVHRMLTAGLMAAVIHGRCDPSDDAAIERELRSVGDTYAAVLRALDRLAPPPER
jgi:hypothetical protein